MSATQSHTILKNLSPKKVLFPILLGLGIVAYLLYREFDMESFQRIEWRTNTILFITLAVLLLFLRQLSYMWRIKTLCKDEISWKQSFEIIALWEFGSAVTPSMVGGTAVALFLLTKEGIQFGRSAAIIFATILLDSVFFLGTVIALWLWFGNYLLSSEFHPSNQTALLEGGPWVYAFLGAFGIMLSYTLLIAIGLLVAPKSIRKFLYFMGKLPFLKRWNKGLTKFADDLETASVNLKKETTDFWVKGFLSTAMAWSARFGVVVCLIVAFVGGGDYLLLYGRQLSLYLILFLTPTPGGSGVADFAFKDFYFEFIGDMGLAALIGLIWRFLTYYPYLLLGVAILPRWINRVLLKNR